MLQILPFSHALRLFTLFGLLLAAGACVGCGSSASRDPFAHSDASVQPDAATGERLDAGAQETGCERSGDKALSELEGASRREGCTQDSDCVKAQINLSCLARCASFATSLSGTRLEQAVAEVEATHCAPHAGQCPSATSECEPTTWVPHCLLDGVEFGGSGVCVPAAPSCPENCAMDDAGVCRGAGDCACPAQASELLGKPCHKLNRRCVTPAFCDVIVDCLHDPTVGALRWTQVFEGCE